MVLWFVLRRVSIVPKLRYLVQSLVLDYLRASCSITDPLSNGPKNADQFVNREMTRKQTRKGVSFAARHKTTDLKCDVRLPS